MAARPPRPGEVVCHCFAYRFPHRFGGGRCHGRDIVFKTWDSWQCGDCWLQDETPEGRRCQVVDGLESETECPAWQDETASSGVRLLGPYWSKT